MWQTRWKFKNSTSTFDKIEWQRQWRAKNREYIRVMGREYAKRWRAKNPDRAKALKKQEHERHKEYYREKTRLWRINNPEKYKAQLERVRLKNKEYKDLRINYKRCISCSSILLDPNRIVCDWCLTNYPQKYEVIKQKSSV